MVDYKEYPLINNQLPTYPAPTITLFRDQLERFRNDYYSLISFAATVCGVNTKDLCSLDMEKWLHKNLEKNNE